MVIEPMARFCCFDHEKKTPAPYGVPGQCMWGLLEQSIRFEDEDVASILQDQLQDIGELS
jgi:hypothetical protein